MKTALKITLLLLITLYSCGNGSQSAYVASNTNLALKSYEDFEKNQLYFAGLSKYDDNQLPAIKDNIKTYYDAILAVNANEKNNKIEREELRKQRNLLYYNYNETLKGILSPAQFELYQNENVHYSKSAEKDLKKYLKKYGLIKA